MNLNKDQYLINGIAKGNSIILDSVYKRYNRSITSYVLKNNGTIEDAKDLFQDGIMAIYNLSQKKEIKLTCSFSTYFNIICRRLWLKKLRASSYETIGIDDMEMLLIENNSISEQTEKYELYQEKFQQLKPKKRQMLELYLDGKRMSEITKIMGLKSEGYARKFKYQCKKKIAELIAKDKRYVELAI